MPFCRQNHGPWLTGASSLPQSPTADGVKGPKADPCVSLLSPETDSGSH